MTHDVTDGALTTVHVALSVRFESLPNGSWRAVELESGQRGWGRTQVEAVADLLHFVAPRRFWIETPEAAARRRLRG